MKIVLWSTKHRGATNFHNVYICTLPPNGIFAIRAYTILGLIKAVEAQETFEIAVRQASKAREASKLVVRNRTKVIFSSSLYFCNYVWFCVRYVLFS